MLSHVEKLLGFRDEAEMQVTEIHNKSFTFSVDDFVIGEHGNRSDLLIKNCIFRNCYINNYGIIHDNLRLIDVTFEDCFFDDHLIVSSNSELKNVNFISKNQKSMGIWVKPINYDKSKSPRIYKDNCIAIDISNYACNCAEIIGIEVARIKFNPENYYIVYHKWRSIQWDNYDCPIFGPVRVNLSRLKLFNCESAIYPIPDKESDDHALFEREMRVINEHGL